MYKKILFPVFFICLSLSIGLANANTFKMFSELGDPPEPAVFMKGNWNNVMDPTGCVILDSENKLTILIRITVAVPDISSFPDIYYTTQFYTDPQSDLLGPISNADLIPEYLPTGELVYTYVKTVYVNKFNTECTDDPSAPISFDYNLTLRDVNGDLYPIEDHYKILIPHALLDEDPNTGELIVPSIVYAGNHDLCCYENTGSERGEMGSSFIQNTNNSIEAESHRAVVNDSSEDAPQSNPEILIPGQSDLAQQASAYPNPFNDVLNIQFSSSAMESTTIELWDINGRLVHHSEHVSDSNNLQESRINTSNLKAGFYYCSLKNNTSTQTFKVLKTK